MIHVPNRLSKMRSVERLQSNLIRASFANPVNPKEDSWHGAATSIAQSYLNGSVARSREKSEKINHGRERGRPLRALIFNSRSRMTTAPPRASLESMLVSMRDMMDAGLAQVGAFALSLTLSLSLSLSLSHTTTLP